MVSLDRNRVSPMGRGLRPSHFLTVIFFLTVLLPALDDVTLKVALILPVD